MKISCGTDIIEIARIKKCCERDTFLKRVYSEKELALFLHKKNPWESLAGNWAAKESFSKCLKTGINFELHEVSCLRDELGCPYFEFSGSALEIVERMGIEFSVSISHTKEYATAMVVCCSKE